MYPKMKLFGATVALSAILLANGASSSPLATGTRRLRNRAAYRSGEPSSSRVNDEVNSDNGGGDPKTKKARRELNVLQLGSLSIPILSLSFSIELDILPPRPIVAKPIILEPGPVIIQPVAEEVELGLQQVVEEEEGPTPEEVLEEEPYDPYLGMGSIPINDPFFATSTANETAAPPVATCGFCSGGLGAEDNFVIPGREADGVTCGEALAHASSILDAADECERLKGEEFACCPAAPEAPCKFCEPGGVLFQRSLAVAEGGLVIPNSVVPDSNGLTCGEAFEHASTLFEEECSAVRNAESICCPELAEWIMEDADTLMSMSISMQESMSMPMNMDAKPSTPSTNPVASAPASSPSDGSSPGSISAGGSAGTPTRMPADPSAPNTKDKLPSGAMSMGTPCLVASIAAITWMQLLL